MAQATQTKLFAQLNDYYATGGSTYAGSDKVHPATTYSDATYLAAERKVIQRHPVIVGIRAGSPLRVIFLPMTAWAHRCCWCVSPMAR